MKGLREGHEGCVIGCCHIKAPYEVNSMGLGSLGASKPSEEQREGHPYLHCRTFDNLMSTLSILNVTCCVQLFGNPSPTDSNFALHTGISVYTLFTADRSGYPVF